MNRRSPAWLVIILAAGMLIAALVLLTKEGFPVRKRAAPSQVTMGREAIEAPRGASQGTAGEGETLGEANPASQLCYQVHLETPPQWINGAVWRDDSSQLLMVDTVQDQLLAFDARGQRLPVAGTDAKGHPQPTAIGAVGSGFLLELADGKLRRLDRDLRFLWENAILSREGAASGLRVGSLYQWQVAGKFLVAYGSLLTDKDQVIHGFFRVPLGDASPKPELLTPFEESAYYLLGNSYLATIGDAAYYVVMSKAPALYKVLAGKKPQKLDAIPQAFRTRPGFKTKMNGPISAGAHFAELETFSVISGLLSHHDDGLLYLLTRRPAGAQSAEWDLYEIDPEKGRLVSEDGLRLPTSAPHLTVAASHSQVFVINRGHVRERQQQTIDSMVVVDVSAIRGARSFLSADERGPIDRRRRSLRGCRRVQQ